MVCNPKTNRKWEKFPSGASMKNERDSVQPMHFRTQRVRSNSSGIQFERGFCLREFHRRNEPKWLIEVKFRNRRYYSKEFLARQKDFSRKLRCGL
jgi:hypothetical protein